MLCNLLKQIFIDNIHNVISKDELIYSQEVKQFILDWWNLTDKIDYVKMPNRPNDISEVRLLNNEILFVKTKHKRENIDTIYYSTNFLNNFCNKYDVVFTYLIISNIVKSLFNVDYTFKLHLEDLTRLGLKNY